MKSVLSALVRLLKEIYSFGEVEFPSRYTIRGATLRLQEASGYKGFFRPAIYVKIDGMMVKISTSRVFASRGTRTSIFTGNFKLDGNKVWLRGNVRVGVLSMINRSLFFAFMMPIVGFCLASAFRSSPTWHGALVSLFFVSLLLVAAMHERSLDRKRMAWLCRQIGGCLGHLEDWPSPRYS